MDKSHTYRSCSAGPVSQSWHRHQRCRCWADVSKGILNLVFGDSSGRTLFILPSRTTLKVYSDIYLMNVYIFLCAVIIWVSNLLNGRFSFSTSRQWSNWPISHLHKINEHISTTWFITTVRKVSYTNAGQYFCRLCSICTFLKYDKFLSAAAVHLWWYFSFWLGLKLCLAFLWARECCIIFQCRLCFPNFPTNVHHFPCCKN